MQLKTISHLALTFDHLALLTIVLFLSLLLKPETLKHLWKDGINSGGTILRLA